MLVMLNIFEMTSLRGWNWGDNSVSILFLPSSQICHIFIFDTQIFQWFEILINNHMAFDN